MVKDMSDLEYLMAKFEFMLQAFTKHQIVPLIEGERYE
jgi:hypothetical protein